MRRVLFSLLIVLGLALAAGRGGYRVEVGERFTIRLWAEQVLFNWGPIEQVAGLELEYGHRGLWYWSPYTAWGFVSASWWVQLQVRYTPGGAPGLAILGGVGW